MIINKKLLIKVKEILCMNKLKFPKNKLILGKDKRHKKILKLSIIKGKI